jgi:intracellular sulfur oxidation DsrE/DsrF family protein
MEETMKPCVFLCLVLATAVANPALAVEWEYPAVQGYGPVVPLPNASAQPNPELAYKVVFDITQGTPGDARVNPGLASVARFVNLLAIDGKMPENSDIVAVIHGSATPDVIEDAAYMARFGTPNPNTELFRQLAQNGVDVVVCGQAVIGSGFAPESVMDGVEVALSAMTVLANRQLEGYAVMP